MASIAGCGGSNKGGDGGASDGGDGDGGVQGIASPSDFENARAVALCQRFARCGGLGASEEAQCETNALAQRQSTPPVYSLDDAVNAGRLKFDPVEAQKCVAARTSAGCTPNLSIVAEHACDKVFTPLVVAGGMCKSTLECIGGYCANNRTYGCASICKVWLATGSTCDPTNTTGSGCDESQDFCHPTNKVCTARVADGAMCGPAARCQIGLFCLTTCKKPGMVGDACAIGLGGADTCSPEFYCNDSLASPVCEVRKAAGADCASYNACNDGLDCIGFDPQTMNHGQCGAWLDIGKMCDPTLSESGCPFLGEQCEMTSKTCVAVGTPGSACVGGDCRDGLYCDAKMKCAATVAIGGVCAPPPVGTDNPCHEGSCDAMTMKCALVCM